MKHNNLRRRSVAMLPLLAMAALLLPIPASTAAGNGNPIRFSAARDYPSANVTYNGTASPGAITHLFRNGKRDKNADLVLSNIVGGPVVLYGVGGGRFGGRHVLNNGDTDASAVQIGDFNGDGIPDIVSGGYTTERLTVMLGNRDGSFQVSGRYLLRGVWPSEFQIADLNRDGHLDIATSAYFGSDITILLGNGDGTFRRAPSVPGPNLALGMAVADFNGDGIPDMAVTESIPTLGGLRSPEDIAGDLLHGIVPSTLLHGTVKILFGNGDGTFRPAASYSIGTLSELVRYADINEDGKGDLVILNALGGNDASILLGLGGGRFAPERRIHVGGPGSLEPLDVRTVDGAEGLQLVDFNRDGHLDMVVTQMISSTLVIFAGDGHGNFRFEGQQSVTGFPEDLLAGDLDGDRCPDLAVPGNVPPVGASDVGVARVSILLNRSAPCRSRATAPGPGPTGATTVAVGGSGGENEASSGQQPVVKVSVISVYELAALPWSSAHVPGS
ncbi:MAG: repeat-containing protein [Marmoricola sp.]|nr:repeat-containing protein [Marmoricola sp.]